MAAQALHYFHTLIIREKRPLPSREGSDQAASETLADGLARRAPRKRGG